MRMEKQRIVYMVNNSYKILYQGGSGEIIEKKSRFIATLSGITEEEQALSFIAALKKQYWDASHNCYAFTIGKNHELQRCSDDGEPSGTAGRPILEILLRENVHNAVIVVTRYFGGTLLGTGGLVRAYQKAAQDGLNNSLVIKRRHGMELILTMEYHELGKVQNLIAKHNIDIVAADYSDKVKVTAAVPIDILKIFIDEIMEGTNGKTQIQEKSQIEYAKVTNKLIFF